MALWIAECFLQLPSTLETSSYDAVGSISLLLIWLVSPTRVASCLTALGMAQFRAYARFPDSSEAFQGLLGMPSCRWAFGCVSSVARRGFRCDRRCFEHVHLGAPLMHNVQENCFLKYLSRGHDISLDIGRFDRGWALWFKTTDAQK
jgi:hypothetical protein